MPMIWVDAGNGEMKQVDSGDYYQSVVESHPGVYPAGTTGAQAYQSGIDTAAAQAAAHKGGGLGGLFGLGLAGAGLYFGMPALSELFSGAGAGAGLSGLSAADAAALADSYGAVGGTAAAGAATGGSMFDINDPSTWNSFDTGGMPDYTSPSTMSPNADQFGNFDMGAGPLGTDPAGAKAALEASQPGLWDKLMQQVGNNPLQAAKIAGQLLSTGLGVYGANQQAKALTGLAGQYSAFGAPSRARFEASMTPGFDPASIPGYSGAVDTASKSLLARLSATGGNPFGNPGGLIEANKAIINGTALPAIQEYQRLNANTGFGNSINAAVNLGSDAITADRGITTAIASGVGSLTNPQPSITDLIAQLQNQYKPNTGSSLV